MVWNRRATDRLAAIDTYRFPATVRQRFAAGHATLSGTALDKLEAATRQWFRLAARHPRARPDMPSRATDALWREVTRQTEYGAFCDRAFGRSFRPGPAAAPTSAPGSTP